MANCSVDWGVIAALVSAGATFLLVIAGIWAGFWAKSAANSASRTLRIAKLEERTKFASRVYSTPVRISTNATKTVPPFVTVVNKSDLPVYDITARIRETRWDTEAVMHHRFLSPGKRKRLSVPEYLVQKWGWEKSVDETKGDRYRTPEGVNVDTLEVTLTFRDSANRSWQREPNGILVDVTIDPTATDNDPKIRGPHRGVR